MHLQRQPIKCLPAPHMGPIQGLSLECSLDHMVQFISRGLSFPVADVPWAGCSFAVFPQCLCTRTKIVLSLFCKNHEYHFSICSLIRVKNISRMSDNCSFTHFSSNSKWWPGVGTQLVKATARNIVSHGRVLCQVPAIVLSMQLSSNVSLKQLTYSSNP